MMFDPKHPENSGVKVSNSRVSIDQANHINEVCFEVTNDVAKPTKHVVFVHGYGASLGCFARNFQIINKFKDMNYNYKIHFLDNISFGLSSNPRIDSDKISFWKIPRCPDVKLNDTTATDPKKLYNKYYKLVDSFSVNKQEFEDYKAKFTGILSEVEEYYLSALDKWRISSGIDQIDYLVGHSYGGYWCASYSIKYSQNLGKLILLSPVGVERHVHSIKNPLKYDNVDAIKPSLDPTSYNFLTRIPILNKKTVDFWYNIQPFLPRLLKFLGPWGVNKYYQMWYLKLFKINKLIDKNGGANLFTSNNDLVYGTNKECHLIIEYLYNSITTGTVSDIYIKNLLTPSTVSKHPLYDKFEEFDPAIWPTGFEAHFLYGQYDFMNSEAGQKLVDSINSRAKATAQFHSVSEGGHNLYIDNPFETNNIIHDIVRRDDTN